MSPAPGHASGHSAGYLLGGAAWLAHLACCGDAPVLCHGRSRPCSHDDVRAAPPRPSIAVHASAAAALPSPLLELLAGELRQGGAQLPDSQVLFPRSLQEAGEGKGKPDMRKWAGVALVVLLRILVCCACASVVAIGAFVVQGREVAVHVFVVAVIVMILLVRRRPGLAIAMGCLAGAVALLVEWWLEHRASLPTAQSMLTSRIARLAFYHRVLADVPAMKGRLASLCRLQPMDMVPTMSEMELRSWRRPSVPAAPDPLGGPDSPASPAAPETAAEPQEPTVAVTGTQRRQELADIGSASPDSQEKPSRREKKALRHQFVREPETEKRRALRQAARQRAADGAANGLEATKIQMQLDKTAGQMLGVDLGEDDLMLEVIEDGLVASWNQEHPDLEVRPGDMVVSVNGVHDADGMFGELQKPQILDITFQAYRPPHGA